MNIYQRILAVMEDVAYVQKEATKVNNQYTFVSHDQVSKVLHPVLVKHGIVVIPTVNKWAQDGNRTAADVTVSFVNAEKPDDRIDVQAFGFGIDAQDKGPGKAVSYATKYAMLKTFVLETGDDPERDSIPHEGADVEKTVGNARAALEKGDWVTLCEMDRQGEDDWLAAWKKLGSKERSAIKKLQARRDEYRDQLNTLAETEDATGFAELNGELETNEARYLFGLLNEKAQTLMTEIRKAA